jgi:hypothetical protein
MSQSQRITAAVVATATSTWHRLSIDDRGEGVISSAIAVLVMALLGALMWVAFKAIFADASARTSTQVGQIGS